jgi:phage terminase large subunit
MGAGGIAELDIDPACKPYRPVGKALDLFYDHSPEVLCEGPAGTGKSRAALEKVHLVLQKYPHARGLLVRKTRESMTQSTLKTFEQDVVQTGFFGDGPARSHRQSYQYRNGSELVVGGMDRASRVLSTEYDIILFDEATESTEEDWETLLSRLRNYKVPFQQAIACCNPDSPWHWLNQRANKGQIVRYRTRHEDNPAYYDADKGEWTDAGRNYVLGTLERLTGVRRLRLREGVWAAAEGRVYDEFDANLHVLMEDLPWSSFKRFVGAVDWGYTHAGVLQVWGLDHDGRMILVHEVFRTGQDIDWWIERAKEARAKFRVGVFTCDSARPDYIQQMLKAGVPATEAYKSVQIGINAVKQRLRVAGDGKPRLMLMHDALADRDEKLVEAKRPWCTAQEFDSYIWAKSVTGQAKEEPVKENDDGMDAMRYAICLVDNLSANKVSALRIGGK